MVSAMGSKIKGFYKGFKNITHIFAMKERELEIGYPTDVKHVAHMGYNGRSGTEPSWMREFSSSPEFSSTSLEGFSERRERSCNVFSTWSSQDLEDPSERHQPTQLFKSSPSTTVGNVPRKHKRIKNKSSSSPNYLS